MAVVFEILYQKAVVDEDISRIAATWKTKIKKAIEEKLTTHPDVYGKPLRRSLKGYRKLRIGDYRVIFRVTGSKILIFAILHRTVVYQIMEKSSPKIRNVR